MCGLKKIGLVLSVALLLCLCASAWADGSVNVEVIVMDGIPVVKLIPNETQGRARAIAKKARPDFALSSNLTLIEAEAFVGIAAQSVEISQNVVAIEARAFADCKILREITIPATVEKIDDSAFEGCEGVTRLRREGHRGGADRHTVRLCLHRPERGTGNTGASRHTTKGTHRSVFRSSGLTCRFDGPLKNMNGR